VKRDTFKNHWQLSRRIACGLTLKDFTTDPQDSDRPTSLSCDLTLSKDPQDRPSSGPQSPLQRPIVDIFSSFSLFQSYIRAPRQQSCHDSLNIRNANKETEEYRYRRVREYGLSVLRTRVKRQNSDAQSCEISFDYRKILQSTVCVSQQ
jgi:hypothetical protein